MSQGALHWPSRRRLFRDGSPARRPWAWLAGLMFATTLAVAILGAGLSVLMA